MILVVDEKEGGAQKWNQDWGNKKIWIAFQDEESDPKEVWVGLTTGGFEDEGEEGGKTTENQNLGDCLETYLDRLWLLDDVFQLCNVFLPTLVLKVGEPFLLFLKSLTDRSNLKVVNCWEEGGGYEENSVRESVSLKEVMSSVKGVEACADDGHGEGGQHVKTWKLLPQLASQK